MAVLIEIRGDQQREYRLADSTSLGRGPSNTIQLIDPLVSRAHAEIRKTDRGYELVDLGSSHGTWVGAQRVTRYDLQDGDEMIIGATRLRFHRDYESVGGRRWSERVDCDLDVQVTLPSGERLTARATDVSLHGLGLVIDRTFALDTELALAVAFPNRWRRLKTRARVIRVSDGEVGVALAFDSDRAQLAFAHEFALLLRSQKADE